MNKRSKYTVKFLLIESKIACILSNVDLHKEWGARKGMGSDNIAN